MLRHVSDLSKASTGIPDTTVVDSSYEDGKDGRVLVLVGELAEIIERRRAVWRDDIPWVLLRDNGNPVRHVDRSWQTARRKAGLPGAKGERKIFHDCRRTTARELSRAGVPDRIAMSIIGHRTRSMYDRSNIVNEEDMRDAMSRVAHHRARRGDNTVTVPEAGAGGTAPKVTDSS